MRSTAVRVVAGRAGAKTTEVITASEPGRCNSTRIDRTGRASARTAFSPALSADGRLVAFPSFGADLVAHDDDRAVDQFARRVAGGRVRRVS